MEAYGAPATVATSYCGAGAPLAGSGEATAANRLPRARRHSERPQGRGISHAAPPNLT